MVILPYFIHTSHIYEVTLYTLFPTVIIKKAQVLVYVFKTFQKLSMLCLSRAPVAFLDFFLDSLVTPAGHGHFRLGGLYSLLARINDKINTIVLNYDVKSIRVVMKVNTRLTSMSLADVTSVVTNGRNLLALLLTSRIKRAAEQRQECGVGVWLIVCNCPFWHIWRFMMCWMCVNEGKTGQNVKYAQSITIF